MKQGISSRLVLKGMVCDIKAGVAAAVQARLVPRDVVGLHGLQRKEMVRSR